jgi:hypothetical protein
MGITPIESAEAESAPATGRRTRRPARLAAAVAIFGVLGALGYYALPPRTEVAPTAVTVPAREPPVEDRPPQMEQGAITTVLPERPAAAPAAVPPIAVPPPARLDRRTVESAKPPAPKAPVRRPQAASKVGAAQASGTDACTAQALALGLCREADEAPAPVAPAAVPRGDEGCTEVAAALGLCEPVAAQRGN